MFMSPILALFALTIGLNPLMRTCYQTEAAHCKASISGRGRSQGICVEFNDKSPSRNVEDSPQGVCASVKPEGWGVSKLLTKQGRADHYHLVLGELFIFEAFFTQPAVVICPSQCESRLEPNWREVPASPRRPSPSVTNAKT